MNEILYAGQQAIWLTLVLSAAPVIVATVLGLVIGLLQTIIQLQEQTLAFAVKLFDAQSQEKICAGTCRHVHGGTVLTIPLAEWGALSEIFVKITAGLFSFYDGSGWREVPCL